MQRRHALDQRFGFVGLRHGDVAAHRFDQHLGIAAQAFAIGADASVHAFHQRVDLLAHGRIADPGLAHLTFHVFDEQFGQPRGAGFHAAFILQPQHDQRQHQRDHVVATLDAVGDAAHAVPVRIARLGHGAVPQRAPFLARVGLGREQAREEGHETTPFSGNTGRDPQAVPNAELHGPTLSD